MTVNGWMGLAWDLRRNEEVERTLEERRGELSRLRRAVVVARRSEPHPIAAGAPAELHRAAVEAQQAILRHAVGAGDLDLVRRTGRSLRVSDFAGDAGSVEALLGVMRDARSGEVEVLDAAVQVAALSPIAG
ncbi:MAG TPA: hypothetical protein VIG06_09920 [Kofleriaceae bacterium]|jgi:hypothetical protein